jgi:hypothetical protein
MAFLENLESIIPDGVNPKVAKIIKEMQNDPDFQTLMQKLAGMEDNSLVTEAHLKDYEERLRYMEDHGI